MNDSIEKIAGEIMQQVLYGATVDWRPNMAQIAQRLRELDSLRQVPEVDAMVSRFLGWPIPKTFAPDCGISFTPLAHPNGWPIGTNLLTDAEARAMFEYVLDVQEADPAPSTSDPKAHECGWPKCECASESRETCMADELNDIANPSPPTSSQGNVAAESLTSGTVEESEATPAQAGATSGDVPMSEWIEAQYELNELRAKVARYEATPAKAGCNWPDCGHDTNATGLQGCCLDRNHIVGALEAGAKALPEGPAQGLMREAANTIRALTSAINQCVEHMEHSTPQGRAAYVTARSLARRGGSDG